MVKVKPAADLWQRNLAAGGPFFWHLCLTINKGGPKQVCKPPFGREIHLSNALLLTIY